MADQADVERALVTLISGILFPDGGYLSGDVAPSIAHAVPPGPVLVSGPVSARVYRGWPENTALLLDLNNGAANVSVYSEPGMVRNTTRYVPKTHLLMLGTPTIVANVTGNLVSLDGAVTAGNVVGVQFGPAALSAAYAYAVLPTDTMQTIAIALANLIPGASIGVPLADGWDAGAGGWDGGSISYIDDASVWIPNGVGLQAATSAPATTITEVRRQEAGFRVSCFCPSPTARDAIATAVDLGIASMMDDNGWELRFFPISSNEYGRIKMRSVYTTDVPSRDRIWRRDLCFLVDYPTSLIQQMPTMMFGGVGLVTAGGYVVADTGAVQPAQAVYVDQDGNIQLDAAGNILGVTPA